MLILTKSKPVSLSGRFAFHGSSLCLGDRNGFAVLHCVTPLRVQSPIHKLPTSHAKAAPKATGKPILGDKVT